MWWVPVAMAAANMMKSKMDNDRAREIEDSDTKLAAETARWSPWTGMRPNQIRHAGSGTSALMGGALQGYTAGAMMNQGFGLDKPTVDQNAMTANPQAQTGYLSNRNYSQELGNMYGQDDMNQPWWKRR